MMLSRTRTKRIVVAILLSATVLLGFVWTPQFDSLSSHIKYISVSHERRLELMLQDALRRASTPKTILLWQRVNTRIRRIDRDTCGNCIVVDNRSLIDAKETAAVIFHHRYITEQDMPKNRRTDQYHIWLTGEAPPSFYARKNSLVFETNYKFNMTMTYRRDSDIYRPNNVLYDISKHVSYWQKNIDKFIKAKTKLAVAFVSNCNGVPGAVIRMQLLLKLKAAGLDIDLFGRCFSNQTEAKKRRLLRRRVSEYKFYFAFENSYHCRDYITEKFFMNSLTSGAVPVVWGATLDDYLAVAPVGSFIHLDEFRNLTKLVEYLNYLDKNDRAYLKYFSWKWNDEFSLLEKRRASRLCQLCRIIHGINFDDIFHSRYNSSNWRKLFSSESMPTRLVHSLQKWYFKTENKECSAQQILATSFRLNLKYDNKLPLSLQFLSNNLNT